MNSRTSQAIAMMDLELIGDIHDKAKVAAAALGLQARGVYIAYIRLHPECEVRCKCCNQVLRRGI